MIASRFLLAAVVVLTTDPGGCQSDIGDDRPPSVSITEARAKVDDWVRDWPLGPGEVTDCGHDPEVSPGTVCTVQRQGQTLVVGVDRWPNGGPLIIHEDGVGAEDPEAFIARALDLLGPTPRSVDCSGDTSFDPCVARFGRGEPLREVRLVPHGGFVDAQVEAPGSGPTTVVGGGPLLRVALERHQHLDGPNVTVRGTVSDNPVTGTPVSDVCVGTDEFLGASPVRKRTRTGGSPSRWS